MVEQRLVLHDITRSNTAVEINKFNNFEPYRLILIQKTKD